MHNLHGQKSEGQTQIIFEHGDTNKMMAWKFDKKESKKALAQMNIRLVLSMVKGLDTITELLNRYFMFHVEVQ